MNRMITIRLFWMLLSWQYWLPWSVHETLKVMNILMGMHIGVTKYCCFVYGNHSRCYCGSLWKATFVHKKLICS